jgi:hypothetical protein
MNNHIDRQGLDSWISYVVQQNPEVRTIRFPDGGAR